MPPTCTGTPVDRLLSTIPDLATTLAFGALQDFTMETSAQQEQHQQQQQQQQQQQKPPGQGLYQCTTCRRTYTRVDHLARHVRSREFPFPQLFFRKHFRRR
jgi:hypothetical protein